MDFEALDWQQIQRIKCWIDKDELQVLSIGFLHLMLKMQLQKTIGSKWLWSWLLHNLVIVVIDCNFRFSNGADGLFLCYWCNECDDDVLVTFDNDENRKMCDTK